MQVDISDHGDEKSGLITCDNQMYTDLTEVSAKSNISEVKQVTSDGDTEKDLTFAKMSSPRSFIYIFLSLMITAIYTNQHLAFSESAYKSYPSLMLSKNNISLSVASSIDNSNEKNLCMTTVIIFRHCEKGLEKSHCTTIGFQRARYIATLFGHSNSDRWPPPSFIFAMNEERKSHINYREIETVAPLSNKSGVSINKIFKNGQNNELSKDILSIVRKRVCGDIIVVCWRHSDIPVLSKNLGCGEYQGCPKKYPGHSFDDVWELSFVHSDNVIERGINPWTVEANVVTQGFDPLHFWNVNRNIESP